MIRRKEFDRWEFKVGNCEGTPQALLPIAESLIKRDGPKAPTTLHGFLGIKYRPKEKVNVIVDYLENQFASYDVCDENHERQAEESRIQVLLASVDDNQLGKIRPCVIQNLGN
jgi:hypothetical protein